MPLWRSLSVVGPGTGLRIISHYRQRQRKRKERKGGSRREKKTADSELLKSSRSSLVLSHTSTPYTSSIGIMRFLWDFVYGWIRFGLFCGILGGFECEKIFGRSLKYCCVNYCDIVIYYPGNLNFEFF